jgi:predicted nucleic acid-binding protein
VKSLFLDTDVCIDYLKHQKTPASVLVMGGVNGTIQAYCSVITEAELLGGCRTPRERGEVASLLGAFTVIPATREDAMLAGELRLHFRQTGLGLGDAFIAATAIRYGLPLLTRNARHFQAIPGLVLETP